MKKIIAAGLMAGMAITGLAAGAGAANARPYCETGSYPGTGSVCVGGPYGPIAVQWVPDSPYSVPSDPTKAAILGEPDTMHFTSIQQLQSSADEYGKSEYGKYLQRLVKEIKLP